MNRRRFVLSALGATLAPLAAKFLPKAKAAAVPVPVRTLMGTFHGIPMYGVPMTGEDVCFYKPPWPIAQRDVVFTHTLTDDEIGMSRDRPETAPEVVYASELDRTIAELEGSFDAMLAEHGARRASRSAATI